jgi:porin
MLTAMPVRVLAAPPPISIPSSGDEEGDTKVTGPFGFLQGINRSNTLLGDMWGLRKNLARKGISLAILDTNEGLGNVSGGTKQGAAYDGLTQIVVQMDTQRAFGHRGGTANVSVLNIRGRNLSTDNLLTLQTASGIEAVPSTRLWEAWYDQKLLSDDRLSLRIGKQSLDQEFMVSQDALYFINTMFGWAMLPSADLPGGGAAYPLATLGARAKFKVTSGVTLLAGIFNGSPVHHDNGGDPQRQNSDGLYFGASDGTLAIAELQFAYPAPGAMVQPGQRQPLGWVYRIGAWYDSNRFADQRTDAAGRSLADPASAGVAALHRGNYAFYAVADRLIWRNSQDPNRTIGVFARAMYTPLKDRNLIDFSVNAGLIYRSPFHYRTFDTFGIGMGYAHVSPRAGALDRETNSFAGTFAPVRHTETFVEATYQYALRPWIQVQPDVQYVFNPGGGVGDPADPSRRIGNELVFGIRTNVAF